MYLLEYGLAFVLLMLAFSAPGLWLQRAFPTRFGAGLPAAFVIGVACWSAVSFALLAFGVFHPVAVRIGLGLAAVGGLVAALTMTRRARFASLLAGVGLASSVASALLIAVLATAFAAACSPGVSFDAQAYHLTLPRLYVEHRGFREVPFNIYSNWPQNVGLLFALAMVGKDYVLAKLVHFGFGLFTCLALFRFCKDRGRPRAGLIAACLYLANGIVLTELVTAYVDLAFAFFFFMGFQFALKACDDGDARRSNLLMTGLCSGLLCGVKLTGVVGAGVLAVLLLLNARRGIRLKEIAICFAAPTAVLVLPWFLKSVWYTGNPVYPFLYGWFGGPYWSDGLARSVQAWLLSVGRGRTVVDYLLLPVRVILESGAGFENFAGKIGRYWIALLPLVMLCRPRDPATRCCLLGALFYFLLWGLASQQIRFLIPALPLLAAATALTLEQWLGRPGKRALVPTLAVLAAALLAFESRPLAPLAWWCARESTARPYAFREGFVPPIFRYIGTELPADAKLLFLGTNQGFFCPREFIADSLSPAWFEGREPFSQLAASFGPNPSAADLRRALRSLAVTHILVDYSDHGRNLAYLVECLRDTSLYRLRHHTANGRFFLFEIAASGTSRATVIR